VLESITGERMILNVANIFLTSFLSSVIQCRLSSSSGCVKSDNTSLLSSLLSSLAPCTYVGFSETLRHGNRQRDGYTNTHAGCNISHQYSSEVWVTWSGYRGNFYRIRDTGYPVTRLLKRLIPHTTN